MYFTEDKIIEIFYAFDEFSISFQDFLKSRMIGNPAKRKPILTPSEVMTITTIFHGMHQRDFKHFYINYVQKHLTHLFPKTVSYNRFVELMQGSNLALAIFLKTVGMSDCTGISFIDSTPLRVCKNKRIKQNKVFKDIATTGKSTMGWFYGFKLHLIINEKGELLNFVITQGNVDDRTPLKNADFLKCIWGKLFADKGYISKELVKILFIDGVNLITGIRNNMKNCLMELKDKILLRKRSVIETINDELKNICHIEHSRHRSFSNFISNTLSALIAYCFFPKKPSIKFDVEQTSQLAIY